MLTAGLLTVKAQAQSCTPTPSGIVGWWQAEGNAADFIGTNSGILLGGLSFTNGEVGQGFWFNNINQGVRIPASPSLDTSSSCTFECWINPTDVSQSHPIFQWGGLAASIESGGVFAAKLITQVFSTQYPTTNTVYSAPGLVVTNAWQHIAVNFIYQPPSATGVSAYGSVYLYYNGVQVGSVVGPVHAETVGPSGDLYLGDSPAQGTDFAGIIDEVSLYTRAVMECDSYYGARPALSSYQIAAIYNAGPGGKCSTPANVLAQPTNEVVLPGGEAILGVVVADPEDYSYQWQLDGTNLPSAGIISTVEAWNPAWNPTCVAVDRSGNLFYCRFYQVLELDKMIVAGTGQSGYSGDGGPATNATMGVVQGIAVDASGNVFIADSTYGTIRKVDTNGIITTFAGNGTNGYLGDGGAATNAELSAPHGVAVDAVGNVFIADSGNNVIRKVDINGMITTSAGNGTNGYSGDGGAATNAKLGGPTGVAVDSMDDVFICDDGNLRIREVNTNGIINTIAGGGTSSGTDGLGDGGLATGAQFANPAAVALDTFGNLFVADSAGERVREIFAGSGIIQTVAGNGMWASRACGCYLCNGGPATAGQLNQPDGVAVDNAGNLFIADYADNCIREVSGLSYPTNFSACFLGNPANAGNYSVVITTMNTHVSVTSSVVTLTIALPPAVRGLAQNGDGSVSLNLATTTNISSRVYAATSLTPPVVWQPIYTNPNGGVWQFTDTNMSGVACKFYRVSTP